MSEYQCMRVWQLKAGASVDEVEFLVGSSVLETQRWIPGVRHLQLLRLQSERKRYVMTLTFVDHGSYVYWRQVEEEAPDYWERYAAILMQWEQLCDLVAEYTGELVLNTAIDNHVRSK